MDEIYVHVNSCLSELDQHALLKRFVI